MTPEQECVDRMLVAELIQRERAARDGGLWQEMADCWDPTSRIDTSWFRGTAAEFIAATERNAAVSKTLSFHQIGPSVIHLREDRAIGDTGCAVHGMLTLHQADVAVISHTRLLTRAHRVQGKWLLAGVKVLYVRDLLVPRNPTQVPQMDNAVLAGFRDSYRFLSYVLSQSGHVPRNDLPGVDLPESVTSLRAEESLWLKGGHE